MHCMWHAATLIDSAGKGYLSKLWELIIQCKSNHVKPTFEVKLYHLVAIWHWATYLYSLKFACPFIKWG